MQNAMNKLRERRRDGEEGFTLIELMVVVLIIAILLAIAIPTFLGARKRAQDRAAQSSLRNGLTAAKTLFTDTQSYLAPNEAGTVTELGNIEPSLTFTADGVSAGPKAVSVTASANQVKAAAKSAGGDCFLISDISGGTGVQGTTYAKTTSGDCKASATATYNANW